MLDIHNLQVSIEGHQILRGLSLRILPGEVHALMGPNGAGKTTLGATLAGNPNYEVTGGEVRFQGKDLLALTPEERSWEGLFLSFQYPVEIPGLSMSSFMRASIDARREKKGLPPLSAHGFLELMHRKEADVRLDTSLIARPVNEGFSGGEKKRNETFQMAMLEPDLAILDETDSGLDIDALRAVADAVNLLRSPQRATLIITHYQRLLDYIRPDIVHILYEGRIVRSGGPELALELEAKGYDWIKNIPPQD
ncbi:MAG: Fe-S cluster assembly ATPase SufC [Tannerellaceae bacterium]|nr:Fe-S cluster assembly ATPase SufC [Tannerellaceae bacterium]